jgi:alkylated DNA nucleotide flippase Atl1
LSAAADASVRLRRFHKVPIYVGAYGRVLRYGDMADLLGIPD